MYLAKIDEFNPEQPFIHDGICFDPIHGSGATGNTANINYMGFVVFIEPRQFLNYATYLHPDLMRITANHFIKTLPTLKWCISPSQFSVTDTEGWENRKQGYWRIYGHEGRHRSFALDKLGLHHIPVFIYPQGLRARDFSPELLKEMSPLQSERGELVPFRPKYIVVNQEVFACSTSILEVNRLEKDWVTPAPVVTETQRAPHPDHDDFEYRWSKPTDVL